jgi:hypothetical protein
MKVSGKSFLALVVSGASAWQGSEVVIVAPTRGLRLRHGVAMENLQVGIDYVLACSLSVQQLSLRLVDLSLLSSLFSLLSSLFSLLSSLFSPLFSLLSSLLSSLFSFLFSLFSLLFSLFSLLSSLFPSLFSQFINNGEETFVCARNDCDPEECEDDAGDRQIVELHNHHYLSRKWVCPDKGAVFESLRSEIRPPFGNVCKFLVDGAKGYRCRAEVISGHAIKILGRI